MKKMILVLVAIVSVKAYAGTEITYLTAFDNGLEVFASAQPKQLSVDSVYMENVPTKIAVDDSDCENHMNDETVDCVKRTVLESTQAVVVNVSYYSDESLNSDSGTGAYEYNEFHLDPKTLSPATLQAITAHKHLSGKAAQNLFSVKMEGPFAVTVPTIDEANSRFCFDESPCDSDIRYTTTSVQKLKISVVAK